MKFSMNTEIVNVPAGVHTMTIAGVGNPRTSSNGAYVATVTFKDIEDRLSFYYVNLDPVITTASDDDEPSASLPVNFQIFRRALGNPSFDLAEAASVYALSPEAWREYLVSWLREFKGTECVCTVQTYGNNRCSVKTFTTVPAVPDSDDTSSIDDVI
ncbi:MAG: hypothetical protein ACO395_07450 [Pontimonas sp.]